MTPLKDSLRWRIAQEAARLMAEEGIHDRAAAKQKAAARLGIPATGRLNLPRNEDIDAALEEHHRIFRREIQPRHIRHLRQLAFEAMGYLSAFAPRLVGSVLEGWAGELSPVTLYLFPVSREDVLMTLVEGGIPFSEKTIPVALGPARTLRQAAFCLHVDGVEIRLILWPEDLRERIAARNQPGADIETVAAMLR